MAGPNRVIPPLKVDPDGTFDSRYWDKSVPLPKGDLGPAGPEGPQGPKPVVTSTVEPPTADVGDLWFNPEGVPEFGIDALTREVADTYYPAKAEVAVVDAVATRADTRVFDVRAYGAVGNGIADDTAALQACAVACKAAKGSWFLPPFMNCRISATLDLVGILDVDVRGQITVAHTIGVGVLVGNSSGTREPTRILLDRVRYAGTQSNVAVRVVGLKNGFVQINRSEYVQLYADVATASMDSIAYSNFTFGDTETLELAGQAGLSWINQNRFQGRVRTLVLAGEYAHNANNFDGLNLENAVVTVNAGQSNRITGRFEGTSAATFAAGTSKNRIVQQWDGAQAQTWPSITVTNNGFDNRAVLASLPEPPVTILRIDAASALTDAASPFLVPHATRRIRPGFRKLRLLSGITEFGDTGIFPLESGTPTPMVEGGTAMRIFRFTSDAAIWRLKVYVYDVNRQPLDGTSTDYMSKSGGWTWQPGGFYMMGSDIRMTRMVFVHADARYARIVLYAGSAGAFEYAELMGYAQAPHGDQIANFIRRQMARPLSKTGATPPTQSLLYPGDSIGTDTGRLLVTARVDTTLAVAAISGATSLTVTTGTGIAVGDNIAVLLADDTTHFTTVATIAGTTITLTAGLTGAANSGADVATNRFLHIT